MFTKTNPSLTDEPLLAMDAMGKTLAFLTTSEETAEITVKELLSFNPDGSAVFLGEMPDGLPLRISYAPHSEHRNEATLLWDKLLLLQATMSIGGNRVPSAMFLASDASVMILSVIPTETAPIATVDQAANWLSTYSSATQASLPFDRAIWADRADQAVISFPPALAPIGLRLIQKIKQLGRKLDGSNWRMALVHGAFTPSNARVHEGCIVSLPTPDPLVAPIFQDISSYLLTEPRIGAQSFGVNTTGIDAFAKSFAFTDIERHGFLPLLLAVGTLCAIATNDTKGDDGMQNLVRLEALFQDLRLVAKN